MLASLWLQIYAECIHSWICRLIDFLTKGNEGTLHLLGGIVPARTLLQYLRSCQTASSGTEKQSPQNSVINQGQVRDFRSMNVLRTR